MKPAPLPSRRQRGILLLGAALLLCLTGCAAALPQQRITAFSAAANLATTNTQAAFLAVESVHDRAQVEALVIDYDTNGFHPELLKPLLADDVLAARMTLLQGLGTYAERLGALANGTQLTALNEEAKSMGGALKTLSMSPALTKFAAGATTSGIQLGTTTVPGSAAALSAAAVPLQEFSKLAQGITTEQRNLLTTGVDIIGNFLIREKVAHNLPAIIHDMNEPVKSLCALLIADIGHPPQADDAGNGLRAIAWRQYDKLLRDQSAFIDHHKDLEPLTRADQIRKLPQLAHEQRLADQTLAATQEALTKLAAAHEALQTAYQKQSSTLGERINTLVAEGKRVKDFYDSLSSTKE